MSKMMQIYNNIIDLKNQVNYIIVHLYDAIDSFAKHLMILFQIGAFVLLCFCIWSTYSIFWSSNRSGVYLYHPTIFPSNFDPRGCIPEPKNAPKTDSITSLCRCPYLLNNQFTLIESLF